MRPITYVVILYVFLPVQGNIWTYTAHRTREGRGRGYRVYQCSVRRMPCYLLLVLPTHPSDHPLTLYVFSQDAAFKAKGVLFLSTEQNRYLASQSSITLRVDQR